MKIDVKELDARLENAANKSFDEFKESIETELLNGSINLVSLKLMQNSYIAGMKLGSAVTMGYINDKFKEY